MKRYRHILTHFIIAIVLTASLTSCGSMMTRIDHYPVILKEINTGKYEQAIKNIRKAKKTGAFEYKDRVLYYLELGTAFHYAGMYDSSNVVLEKADHAMDDLFTKSISKAAASLLLNDNALDYFGDDYEQIYVNVFKALNYMHLGDLDGAMVEARRVDIKLNELEAKYRDLASNMSQSKDLKIKVEYDDSPLYDDVLARYLSMSLYRAEGNPDDAGIDHNKINELYTNLLNIYEYGEPEFLENPQLTSDPLQIIAFTGLAPEKYPVTLKITTYENLLSIRSSSGEKDKYWMNIPMEIKEGYHFKFQLPEIRKTGTAINRIRVFANDQPIGELEVIEDMQNVAYVTFQTHQRLIYFKTIARAIIKGLASAKLKEKLRKDQSKAMGFLTDFITDVAVDATENADLRFWRTMPGFAWGGEFDLKPGTYSIRLEFLDKNGVVNASKIFPETKVGQNRLNFIECNVHH